jgi:hypothetical protein
MHLELTPLLQIKIQTKVVLKYIIALLAGRQPKHRKKGKGKVSEGYLSNDIVNSFNVFQLKKLQAIEKMAEATSEHAKAIAKQAAANEEKTKDKKLSKYLKLVTNFSAEQKAGHDIILKRLTKELFSADES